MLPHEFHEHVTDGPAGEVGRPVAIGKMALVPTRLVERGDMCQHEHMGVGFQGLRQDRAEMLRRLVPQRMK